MRFSRLAQGWADIRCWRHVVRTEAPWRVHAFLLVWGVTMLVLSWWGWTVMHTPWLFIVQIPFLALLVFLYGPWPRTPSVLS
ncbi:hypothetical protein [Sulfobacillus thermosulfidooxidans]|uniref:hypothetical protein n=1 Tax=Sulfobacillus thermosulfidooxidans TaxID=28034 RepID=UPI0006B445B4|nr:hypothetical protein [Sulfobacillus thermosulfidooxidans]